MAEPLSIRRSSNQGLDALQLVKPFLNLACAIAARRAAFPAVDGCGLGHAKGTDMSALADIRRLGCDVGP